MAVKILWTTGPTPEMRKRVEWERIIRFEVGEGPDLDVTLELKDESHHWHVGAVEPLYRQRIVQALRAAGKPAE